MTNKRKLAKRLGIIGLGVMMMFSTMTGCRGLFDKLDGEDPEQISGNPPTDFDLIAKQDTQSGESEERNAYLDFLNGNISAMTSEYFAVDDGDGNYDGIYAGRYDYRTLKVNFEESDNVSTDTKYTFVDFGQDGTEELVVRFQASNDSYFSWTGIFHYEDGNLSLVYAYRDGYRTSASLLTNGRLIIGGSYGAGAYGMEYMNFDAKGNATCEYTSNHYCASFVTYVAYDLTEEYPSEFAYYDETLVFDSTLEVLEYVVRKEDGTAQTVKMCADGYSTDDAIRAAEQQLVADLVALGAEEISCEEMDELVNKEEYSASEVTWLDWEDNFTIVRANDSVWVEYLEQYQNLNLDSDEYAFDVLIEVNNEITDVKIYKLTSCDYTEGGLSGTGEIVGEFDKVTRDNPLVLHLSIPGDLPSYVISYTDANGEQFYKSIEQSGMDGRIHLYDFIME